MKLSDLWESPDKGLHVVRKCYYTPNRLMEQSYDIYLPSDWKEDDQRPIVLLVVGSAWVGHWSFVAWGNDIGNTPGPRTMAKAGYGCISIRHRGSFPHLFLWEHMLLAAVVIGLCMLVLQLSLQLSAILALIFAKCVQIGHETCAKHDEMVENIATALRVIRSRHSHDLLTPRRPVIFGGYSSGAHVAATLLAMAPEQWKAWDLPARPEDWISGILYISGVLAVSSTPTWQPTCKKAASTIQHYSPKSVVMDGVQDNADSAAVLAKPPTKFEWVTNFLTAQFLGLDWRRRVPSPLFLHKPRLPHLLLTCGNTELFLPILTPLLGIYFSSRQYIKILEHYKIPCKYVELRTNHWFVLNSMALREGLRKNLGILYDKDTKSNMTNNSFEHRSQ